jgi:hypothetical protein
MKKLQSLWFLSALVVFLSVGISLNAQTAQSTSTPDAQSQPSTAPSTTSQPASAPEQAPNTTPGQAQPGQTPGQTPDEANRPAPGAQAPNAQATDTQTFTGTIVKTGDKYMLQDDASGKAYDLDHQSELQKYEGKKVKVHGTLDASGKTIHVQ